MLQLTACKTNAQQNDLKLVFIRHGERPDDGDNLTCKGFNRSLLLPAVLYKKFGKPANIYVPSVSGKDATKHARMFQTITPFAVKYNLAINSAYDEADYKHIGKALLKESGTVIIVWEHNSMVSIVDYLGVQSSHLQWPDDDYDSIWIVTYRNGTAVLTKDKEGLNPSADCAF
jgi:hypothetical protein